MKKSLKDQLLSVPADKLIDLLFELAADKETSWSKIERLVARPKNNSNRYKNNLKQIKNRGGFNPWKYSSQFSDELTDLLEDLKTSAATSEIGFELILDFYKSDENFFEQCDDSSGHIGSVFSSDAIDLYITYAAKHSDREYVIRSTVDLINDDGYGVRDQILTKASQIFSPDEIRKLFSIFEESFKSDPKKYQNSHWQLRELAKELKDAPLFEKLAHKDSKIPNSALLIEIAEVYFLSGNTKRAQEVIDTIDNNDSFRQHEIEDLQKKIYLAEGKTDELCKITYNAFQKYYSEHTLKELLTVAGEDKKDQLINEAVEKILSNQKWSNSDAEFLKYISDSENLQKYVIQHRVELDERIHYSDYVIADYLKDNKKYLGAVLLYRCLISLTLAKVKSKNYHHAVGYLEILDQISKHIKFWDGIDDHIFYLQNLKKTHALKKSFWSMYKN